MTLLGNKYGYTDDDEREEEGYTLPAVCREEPKHLTLKKSIILSTILHPVVVGLAWLIVFLLALWGINLLTYEKPEMKPKDIEFVLVNKEGTPINKNTPFRSDRNSRAGGINDPKRKVSMPEAPAPAAKKSAPSQSSSAPKQTKKQVTKQPSKAKTTTKHAQSQSKPAPAKSQIAEFFAPRPTAKPSPPKPTTKPKVDFAIPVPKTSIPHVAAPSGGPLTTAEGGKGTGAGSSGSGGSGRPAPSFSPSGTGSGSGAGRFSGSKGGTGTGGNVGNPGPGNPHGAPGIDAIKEPDFGPYMRELQRRIKMNWDPPKGNESKRVVLLFSISRDGRLLNVKVYKSSGLAVADKAAISAVQLTAPFKPLPPDFKGNSVDIQFTFDYNVFGASRY